MLPLPIQIALDSSYNLSIQTGNEQLSAMEFTYNSGLNVTILSSMNYLNETVLSNSTLGENVIYENNIVVAIPGEIQIQGNEILFYSIPQVSVMEIIIIAVAVTAISMSVILILLRKSLRSS